ncbi:MAG: cytochrome c [Sphingomonadaceae bacterium]|nr:cytochrome c [Sphingomonadaceae bacterium]
MRTRLIIGLAAAGFASAALAQAPSIADQIKARQTGMKSVGAAFKGIRDELGGTPNAAAVKRHAAVLASQSPKVVGWFGPGTASAPGVKTAALPAIWARNADFRKAAGAFGVEARKMLALANAGDMAAVGGQVRALGGTCKGCHDDFKVKDD